MSQPFYPILNLRTFNVYPDQFEALGFPDFPDRLIIRQTKEEATRFDPKVVTMSIFQEDNMIKIYIPLGLEFFLKSPKYSLGVKFTNAGLVSVTGDAPEKEAVNDVTIIGCLVPPRMDAEYNRLHPEVLKYIKAHTTTPEEYENEVNEWLEDLELINICDARKDQKRIRVDIDKL